MNPNRTREPYGYTIFSFAFSALGLAWLAGIALDGDCDGSLHALFLAAVYLGLTVVASVSAVAALVLNERFPRAALVGLALPWVPVAALFAT